MNAMKLLVLGLLWATGAVLAVPITPNSTLIPLPAATFGGSGIPNTSVAVTNVGNVTLGLSAAARFDNPTVTNNGAGTFYALAGVDNHAPSPGDPYALWNFNYYIGGTITDYNYKLFYDFDPGVGTDESLHGVSSLLGAQIDVSFPTLGVVFPSQNSLNLGMNFLQTPPVPLVLQPPAFSPFNPNAVGSYTFALVAYEKTGGGGGFGAEVGRTAMEVTAVPEPGTYALLLAGLSAVTFVARRRRKQA